MNLVFLPSYGCSGKSVLSTARHQGGIPRSGTPGPSVADGRAGPRSLSKLRGAETTPGLVQPSDCYHGNRHRLPTAGAPLLTKPKSPHSRGQLNGPKCTNPTPRTASSRKKATGSPPLAADSTLSGASGSHRPLTPEVGGRGSSW